MMCPNCNSLKLDCIHNKVWSIENGKVYRCQKCDLGFIDPIMSDEDEALFYSDYNAYVKNRWMTPDLSLDTYHQRCLNTAKQRVDIVAKYFQPKSKVLEVGFSTGAFLSLLKKCETTAVEISNEKREYSRQYVTHDTYKLIEDVPFENKYDVICMFHVFEHMKNPFEFLEKCSALLSLGGIILLEVPHIEDPLMSLYDIEAFKDFVFQPMHPMIYSKKSLDYVFHKSGFAQIEVIYYQRYGLGNHLAWLKNNKPGGDSFFSDMFEDNQVYKQKLVEMKKTDTIFYIVKKGEL